MTKYLDTFRNALLIVHVIRQDSIEYDNILAGVVYLWCTDTEYPNRVCIILVNPNDQILQNDRVTECLVSLDPKYPCSYHWISVYEQDFRMSPQNVVPIGWHIECEI